MDEGHVDALFARYVEHLVVHGTHLDVDELASSDSEVAAALRARIQAFQRIDEALGRRSEPLTGKTLARYRIFEKLGAGGMGEVYRAQDVNLDRDVAIKVLPQVFALDPERRTRFEREARMLAALDHRSIAAIYGLEQADGLQFLVLELVPGETLAERIERGPLPLAEALTLFNQIALALEAAHSKGIIHRDLKPANVKITPDGQAKVLDFGLGKTLGPQAAGDMSESLALSREGTVTGLILGTAAYMSPEQSRGQEVDRRTDIWSFGCVFYEALTGRKAFPGANFSETVAAILEREPDWAELPAGTPASVSTLLRRCLSKTVERRLHDIADARIEIEDVLNPPQVARGARRPRLRLLLGGAALAAVLLGLLWIRSQAPTKTAPSGREASNSRQAERGFGRFANLEAYRSYLRDANVRWRQSFERQHGRSPGGEPYLVYVATRRPPTLKVIDPQPRRVIASIAVGNKNNADLIMGTTLSRDGARAYVANKNQDLVYVFDTAARVRLRVPVYAGILVRDDPAFVLTSPDGNRVYVTGGAGYVSVIDTDAASPTFHAVRRVPDGDAIAVGRDPRQLALTPDGTRMYVPNGLSDTVSVIDTDPQSSTYHKVLSVPDGSAIRVGQEPDGIAISPDGQRVYVANTLPDTVSVIDADRASATFHTVVATIGVGVFPIGIGFTPDGTRAYVVAREDGNVAVIDTASHAVMPIRIAMREIPGRLAISPDGTRAYVNNVGSRDVSVIDIDPMSQTFHNVVDTIPVEGQPSSMVIGPPPPQRK